MAPSHIDISARSGSVTAMNLAPNLDIFRTRGRAASAVTGTMVRELDRADLALLQEEKGSEAPALKRLSERHHALARTLAGGTSPGQAAVICGYVGSRVSILLSDPAFKELVEFYRADVNAQYRGMHEELAGFSHDALLTLRERLEDEPEKFSLGQLMEATKLGADRTGFGPQSASVNVNVNVDLASRLEQARKRVAERKTIEGTFDPIP